MPDAEGLALHDAGLRAGPIGLGPMLEVGTYCGKSAVYLGAAAGMTGSLLFSVDHHRGSEELQPGWPHHDPEVVDPGTGAIDTLPFARRTVREAGLETSVVLVVGESAQVARAWTTPLALVFIDGGHGAEVAWADYRSWAPKVPVGGCWPCTTSSPTPPRVGRCRTTSFVRPGPRANGRRKARSARSACCAAPAPHARLDQLQAMA